MEYSGVQVRKKRNSPVNVRFNSGRQMVHFLVFKTFINIVLSCKDISANLYICYICIQGEAWTGTE